MLNINKMILHVLLNLPLEIMVICFCFLQVPTIYSRLIQGYEAMDPELKATSAFAAKQLRLMVGGLELIIQDSFIFGQNYLLGLALYFYWKCLRLGSTLKYYFKS